MSKLNTMSESPIAALGLSRLNQILIALFVLQLVVAVIVFWPRTGANETLSLAIDGFEVNDVTALTVTNESGESVTLQKEGDGWVLADSENFPANETTISEVLGSIVGLSTDRLVTRTEASHKRLQVADDDFVRKILVETANGDSRLFYLGSSPNVDATHIRLAGEDEIYLTGDLATYQVNASLSSWIDTEYFQVAAPDIKAIQLENGNGSLSFARDEAGNWTMAGLASDETLAENNVVSLASSVAVVRLVEPIGQTEEDWFELDTPAGTVTLTIENETEGEQTVVLQVGSKDEENRYVVKSSTSPYYVWAADFSVDDIVEKSRADYIVPPETEEEAEPGAGESTNSD